MSIDNNDVGNDCKKEFIIDKDSMVKEVTMWIYKNTFMGGNLDKTFKLNIEIEKINDN
ncbi:hypothetical protein FJQ98_16240 [Lysinibacillus agricola]|uniref:Uncharacterized protein n=1 Tax=Lysinibacillus agricola TaxID=2590012 RepID=A0ABX7ALY3_9BACI|nr:MULTISPECIES: hypothetical protein [Lysinibacillus]QQP10795.1 hypothetical protein FJQ98_16240 [Lysinibacillus agricola]